MATVTPSIYYTEASRWFMEQLLELELGTQNGGIYANKPGYHNTRAQNLPTNYSVTLPPDKLGPSNKAAGYDWTFPTAQGGDYALIDKYSSRLLAAGQANDPRTDGWREFYGQADSDTAVEGWDFYYNGARTSDSSHLWHIHLSELRQFTEDLRNKQAMLSILSGQTLGDWLSGGDNMPTAQEVALAVWGYKGTFGGVPVVGDAYRRLNETRDAALTAAQPIDVDDLAAAIVAALPPVTCECGGATLAEVTVAVRAALNNTKLAPII